GKTCAVAGQCEAVLGAIRTAAAGNCRECGGGVSNAPLSKTDAADRGEACAARKIERAAHWRQFGARGFTNAAEFAISRLDCPFATIPATRRRRQTGDSGPRNEDRNV